MTKEAAATLALGIAGAIITCAFIAAFCKLEGFLWLVGAVVTPCYTLSKLWEIASNKPASTTEKS
jgi:4-hydroxybenzoate polyprenyltransferase